jgi:predicted membrane chloride channel (bestrophin family)
VESFLTDLEKLSCLQNGDIDLLRNTHSKRDSSYTKSWSFPEWERHQAVALVRYRHHLATWITSPTARAVLPAVGAVVGWALFVLMLSSFSSTVNEFLRGAGAGLLSTAASFNAPIALLLTLRTNRSLDRLLEARAQWGVTTKAVTSLAGMSRIYYYNKNDDTDATEVRAVHPRHQVFSWVAIWHCTVGP